MTHKRLISQLLPTAALICGLALPVSAVFPLTAYAADPEPAEPAISIVQSSAQSTLDDLKYLLSLTTKTEQEQWDNISGVMSNFLPGIDLNKPIRIDIILTPNEEDRYRPSFPIADLGLFRDNLTTFGIESKKSRRGPYELKGDFEGFMLDQNGYATIATTKDDLPANLPAPDKGVADLAQKYDLGVQIRNQADGVDSRRKAIQTLRTEVLASAKQRPETSEAEFALEKMLVEHQFDELERFFTDAAEIVLGWSTDAEKEEGRLDVTLSATPETSLAESIALVGSKPSKFPTTQRRDEAILFGRLNFPLDEMRRGHLTEFFQALQPVITSKLEGLKKLSDAEREATVKISDVVFEMLHAGVKLGVVDGFVDVAENDADRHTAIGALRVADSEPVTRILKLIPQAKTGQTAELEIETVGDVALHKVVIDTKTLVDLSPTLGDVVTVFVATGPEVVWYAVGDDMQETLKARIVKAQAGSGKATKAAAPEATPSEKSESKPAEKEAEKPKTTTADAGAKEKAEGKPADSEKKAEAPVPAAKDKSSEVQPETNKPTEATKPAQTKPAEKPAKTKPETAEDVAIRGDSAPFFELFVKVGPWIERLDAERAEKGDVEGRKLALEAMEPGDDTLQTSLKRVGDHIEGRTTFGKGLLRFVGKMIAKFSAENL